MTIISSKEFAGNHEKYFDMALNEQVFIQRESDNVMFVISHDKKEYLEPDDDLRRDELFDKVKENILKKYTNK